MECSVHLNRMPLRIGKSYCNTSCPIDKVNFLTTQFDAFHCNSHLLQNKLTSNADTIKLISRNNKTEKRNRRSSTLHIQIKTSALQCRVICIRLETDLRISNITKNRVVKNISLSDNKFPS